MRRQATSAFLLVWCFAFSLPPTTKSWAFTIQSTKALSPNPIPYRNAYNHAIRKNRFSAAGVRPTAIFSQSSGGLQPSNQVVDREESSTKSEELLPPPALENHEATYVPTKLLDSSVDEIGLIDEPDPASNADLMDPEWKDLKKKLFNGTLLAVSFGFVIFTVLNIDHGMTRGWTQSEIAMRIPLDNWANYESSLEEKPIFTKTLINVVIYLLGDWLSQTLFQKKNVLDFDASRTLRNGFIGLCFGPLVHEYYQFSDHILPVEGGIWNRVEKILMDQTIYLTVKCSVYISAVGLLQGDDWSTVKQTVKDRIGGIVFTAWKFWPLVHCITYSVIPAQHRILWVNSVDLIWNAILASMSQKEEPKGDSTDEPVVAVSTMNDLKLSKDENGMAEASAKDLFFLQQEVVTSATPFGSNSSALFDTVQRSSMESSSFPPPIGNSTAAHAA
jgi:protein Mpv17